MRGLMVGIGYTYCVLCVLLTDPCVCRVTRWYCYLLEDLLHTTTDIILMSDAPHGLTPSLVDDFSQSQLLRYQAETKRVRAVPTLACSAPLSD